LQIFYDYVTLKCSEKMSPFEGDGDIEQERTGEVVGVKPDGGAADNWDRTG